MGMTGTKFAFGLHNCINLTHLGLDVYKLILFFNSLMKLGEHSYRKVLFMSLNYAAPFGFFTLPFQTFAGIFYNLSAFSCVLPHPLSVTVLLMYM